MFVSIDTSELVEQVEAAVKRGVDEALGQRIEDGFLDVKGASAFLCMSVGAINSAVTRGTLPLPVHRTANGRRRFLKSELSEWARAGDVA
jgi:hypothetical protein